MTKEIAEKDHTIINIKKRIVVLSSIILDNKNHNSETDKDIEFNSKSIDIDECEIFNFVMVSNERESIISRIN